MVLELSNLIFDVALPFFDVNWYVRYHKLKVSSGGAVCIESGSQSTLHHI